MSGWLSDKGWGGDLASPGPIGNVTPSTGAFTTLSATTSVTSPIVKADGSGGGTLQSNNGTACLQWGGGGGANVTIDGGLSAAASVTLQTGTANGVLYLNGSKAATSGSALVFDGANLGVGVTPSIWDAGYKAIQLASGQPTALMGSGNQTELVTNAYYGSSAWRYVGSSVPASRYSQQSGVHYWFTAASGTAGNAITFTQAMKLDANGYLLVGYTTSNGAYNLQVNSQIFATSATIATSDGRYKENVKPIENALDIVKLLNPVSFNWKEHPVHNFDRSTKTVGFIAQEVQDVLSNTDYVNSIVKKNTCTIFEKEINENGDTIKDAVTEDFYGIAEGNLIALLTKAIQEQQKMIEALQAKA